MHVRGVVWRCSVYFFANLEERGEKMWRKNNEKMMMCVLRRRCVWRRREIQRRDDGVTGLRECGSVGFLSCGGRANAEEEHTTRFVKSDG